MGCNIHLSPMRHYMSGHKDETINYFFWASSRTDKELELSTAPDARLQEKCLRGRGAVSEMMRLADSWDQLVLTLSRSPGKPNQHVTLSAARRKAALINTCRSFNRILPPYVPSLGPPCGLVNHSGSSLSETPLTLLDMSPSELSRSSQPGSVPYASAL
ncbi:unnamed protein product [Pleuronectes platessa]|uniref:Uncharacterized protein n=1 Tax=Pleuronectes platessa TaxID=8262 RepID=A0A9N7YBV0_PLEPL|nr:unnamed protein product [Pleuronectes platessa]